MATYDMGQLAGVFAPPQDTAPGRSARQLKAIAQRSSKRDLVRKALARHMEGLNLFQPLPHLEAFHASKAKWRVVDGGNRSSKTMTTCVEFCRAFLGCDPHAKYPKRGGNAIVVGMLQSHIEMIWRKCASSGSFKMIRDEHTNLYRAVRPDPDYPTRLDPYDAAYQEKWKDAPPLIPERMIAGRVAWEDRGKGIPAYAKSVAGWTVHFHSSKSTNPPQGDHYNFALIDEELINGLFLTEIQRGLVALDEPPHQRPRGVWSATAQTTNPELLEMREQADGGAENIHAFKALIKDNCYVPEEEKQAFFDSLSEEDRRVRYYGEYALAGMRCYSTFDPQGVHGFEPMEIPPNWCRYIILDPGHRHCGTLFVAVDPQEKHVWVYDGFDLRKGDPASWAARIATRDEQFEAAVIDAKAGKQKQMGAAVTVARSYKQALDDAGVSFRQLGPMDGFLPGSDDQPARQVALQTYLTVRQHGPFAGTPKLLVARGRLPELESQIRHAHMDMRDPNKRSKPSWDRWHEDLVVCAEYLAAHNPRYFEPATEDPEEDDGTWQAFQDAQRHMSRRRSATSSPVGAMIEMG